MGLDPQAPGGASAPEGTPRPDGAAGSPGSAHLNGHAKQGPSFPIKWWTHETAIFLAATLLLIVGVIFVRLREPTLLTTVQVAIGSEDADFFQNQQVQQDLANDGYTVVPIPMGSRQMAQNVLSLSGAGYDAILPSSDDFAQEAVDTLSPQLGDLPVFSTPLAVFTWQDLIPQLQADGIVDSSGRTFNVGRYLAAADANATWTVNGTQKPLLLDMTDPAKSDSGAMFLGAASIVLNGGSQVQSANAAEAIASGSILPILKRMGSLNNTTAHLFQSYLNGESAEPLALGYESEYLEYQRAGQLPAGTVILQVSPSVICVHTLVPLNGRGVGFAAKFYSDKGLLTIAAQEYGFVDSPGSLKGKFVNAPSYQIIEAMIGVVG
jgi:hypothetical protein